MRTAVLSAADLGEGLRLDASYHCSVGKQIASSLHKSRHKTSPLAEVAQIDIPSRFTRAFVDNLDAGYFFITGSSMQYLEPRIAPSFVSRKLTTRAEELMIHRNDTLVTCSGDIGNCVYVGSTLAGCVGSPDILRVRAKKGAMAPEVLFAFLSSPAGKAMMRMATYGQTVPHIEEKHAAPLPIPVLGEGPTRRVVEAVQQAARLRDSGVQKLRELTARVEELVGWSKPKHSHESALAMEVYRFSPADSSLDAFHYVGYTADARKVLNRFGKSKPLSSLGYTVSAPNRLSREYGAAGTPYVSGSDLYGTRVKPTAFIIAAEKELSNYYVRSGTLLLQSSGQRYGLLGRPWLADERLREVAVSHDLMRVRGATDAAAAYLYVLFNGDFGRRLLLASSHGTQIPHLAVPLIAETRIPDLGADGEAIGREALAAWQMTAEADRLEQSASGIVEKELGMG